MRKKNLKTILKGGVLLLPALLLLSGNGTESKAMLRSTVGRLSNAMRNIKFTPPSNRLPKLNRLNLPTGLRNVGGVSGNGYSRLKESTRSSTLGFANPNYKSNNSVKRSNSDPIRSNVTSPLLKAKPKSFSSPSTSNKSEVPPPLPPREENANFQKLDPQYDTVPRPIFTPRNPGDKIPEPEVYENVTQIYTKLGTLTLFKDK